MTLFMDALASAPLIRHCRGLSDSGVPMRFSRRQIVLGSLASGASRALAQAGNSVRLTFVHTNDVYKMSEEEGRGGMARLAAVVKAERAKHANVLFTHGGDTLSPNLMSGFDQGEHMIAMFNELALDVFAPGNHEFDFGPEVYRKRMAEAKFPVLAANMREADGSRLAGHRDTLTLERGGVKIGFVGAAIENTPFLSSSGPIKFAPLIEAVLAAAAALRAQGADIVVAVIHTDKGTGQKLLATRAVDLILCGHSHDLQVDYDGKSALVESSQDALYVVATDIDVTISGEGAERRAAWRPSFRIVDSRDVTPDPAMRAMVAGYEGELSKELDVEVAVLGLPLDSTGALVRSGETAIGNFIADAMRVQNGADIAITNGGGIRGNKRYPAGHKLTRRDILSEMPFGNKSGVTKVTGKALLEAIENGLSGLGQPSGRFPQVSGVEIVANRDAPRGSRVVLATFNGAPLDPARVYRVATNDFMLRGGDGYGALKDPNASEDIGDRLIANDVMVYARKLATINARIEGRIVVR